MQTVTKENPFEWADYTTTLPFTQDSTILEYRNVEHGRLLPI